MHTCPSCSAPLEAGTKYCPQCGCCLEESFIENPVCPVCHKSYPAGTLYCSEDGTKLVSAEKATLKCVICGTAYPADTKFCPKDGGAVIAEALHRSKDTAARPQNNAAFERAPIGDRFLAYLLDYLICLLLSLPSIILLFWGLLSSGHSVEAGSLCFGMAFLLCIVPIVYSLIKDGLGNGQSWGKKVMNLKVVYVSNQCKCTKWGSALRALMSYVLNLIPLVGWLIEPILVLATADGRRVADRVAGTIVVKAN